MGGQQKLLSLWVCLLFMAALCPCAPYASSKHGFGVRGRGKGGGNKEPLSQSKGLSKQGLKWAGTAAAGVLGGTGTGYGLGFLGRPKHGSRNHDHKSASSDEDQRHYYNEGQGNRNHSLWRAFVKAAAPAPTSNVFLTFGHLVSFLMAAWIRAI